MMHTRLFLIPNSQLQTPYDRINAVLLRKKHHWNLLGSSTHIFFLSFFFFSNCVRGVNANFCSSFDTCVQYLVFSLRDDCFFSFFHFYLFKQIHFIAYSCPLFIFIQCDVYKRMEKRKINEEKKPVISSMMTEKRFSFSSSYPKRHKTPTKYRIQFFISFYSEFSTACDLRLKMMLIKLCISVKPMH